MGLAMQVMPELNLTRYVKRCVQCRRVQGNSSFAKRNGQRGDVCRQCASLDARNDSERRRTLRQAIRRLATLTARERLLTRRLDTVRANMRAMEREILNAEQGDLLGTNP